MGWGQRNGKSKRLRSTDETKWGKHDLERGKHDLEPLESRQLLSGTQSLVNPNWIITNDVGPAGLSAGDTVSDGGTHTGATYLVDAFSTIQDGIDNVDPGGEVILLAGTYSGNISISKAVKLTALAGANTAGVTIDLNSGADVTGSTGVTASAVNVHSGAHLSDGLLLVAPGGTVTVDAGSFSDDVAISKSVKLVSSGGTATFHSFALNNGASLVAGSTGVTSTSIAVNAGAKLQDAITLASTSSQTTVTAGAASYAETVAINKNIKFAGTATVTAIVLNTGTTIASPSSVTSTDITVNGTAKLQQATTLASSTALTTITAGAATYAETVTITKSVKFLGTATVTGFILNAGASVTGPSNVTSTTITVNTGAKLQDAITLGSNSAQTTITLSAGAGPFAETVSIAKNVKFSGTATVTTALVLNSGALIASPSSLTSTDITVNNGAKIGDAVTLASTSLGANITVQAGNYPETVPISKKVRLNSTGTATVNAFSLFTGETIDPLSSGVSATSITINSGAKLQDAMYLASPIAQTTLSLQSTSYAETVSIGSPIKFAGLAATVSAFVLNSGASIAASPITTSADITVNAGAKVTDALALAGSTAAQITLAPGIFSDDVTVSSSIKWVSTGATLHSITLASGAAIDVTSSGVTSSSITVAGGKAQDAMRMAAVGTAATPTDVILTTGTYAEDVLIPAKFIRLSNTGGSATVQTITLSNGTAIDAGSSGVSSSSVTVNTGARVADAVQLVSTSGLVKLAAGAFPDSVSISKSMQFRTISSTATVASITLNSGANLTGSINVSSTDIHVSGGTLADALLLAAPSNLTTTTITLNAGTYNESPTIAGKRIKFAAIGGTATITGAAGVTLDTNEIIDPASANVFANTVTVNQTNGSVKVQDAVLLVAAGGTVKVKPAAYAETVAIGRSMKFATVSGVATLAGIALNSGGSLAGSANVTSANITVNGGLVSDAMLLAATGTLANPTLVTLTAPTYAETVTLPAKFLRLSSALGSTLAAIVISTGATIDPASSGVSSTSITMSPGIKLQDAISLASGSAQSTITVAATNYPESIAIGKDLKFVGGATVSGISLNAGGNVASPSSVTSTNVIINNGGKIAGGIAVAAAGSTLTVAAGTYAGDLTIDKTLTLNGSQVGVDGMRTTGSESIIAGAITVTSGATNVTLDGFTIDRGAQGSLINSAATAATTLRNNIVNANYASGSDTSAVINLNAGTFVAISHNKISAAPASPAAIAFNSIGGSANITNNDIAGMLNLNGLSGADVQVAGNNIHNPFGNGILLTSGTVHDLTITANQLNNNLASGLNIDGATLIHSGTTFTLSLNSFSGNATGASLANIAGVTVSDNQFTGNATALSLANASNLTISLNTISANNTAGIDISGPATHDITIAGNFIQNNHNANNSAGFGVHVSAGTNLHLTGNSISGNFIALANNAATTVDATSNWWGSANGPTAADNTHVALPKGDQITGNVSYAPWQTDGTDISPADGFQPIGATFSPITNSEGESYESIQAALDGTNATGTITIATGSYAEAITINKPITLIATGGVTVTSISLTSGAVIGATSSGVTSPLVTVNNGAIAQDGVTLAAAGGTVALQSGAAFTAQNLNIAKSLTLTQTSIGGVLLHSITLNNGAIINSTSSGVTSLIINASSGARLTDAVLLAASGGTITLSAATFTGDLIIDKNLTINGNKAGSDARPRTGLAADESRLTGSITILNTATNVTIDGVAIDNGKPDLVVVSHATGAFTLRNSVVNANHSPTGDYLGPTISIDNAATVVLAQNKIISPLEPAAGNLAIGFAGISDSLTIADNDIAGSISLAGIDGAEISVTGNTIHDGSANGLSLFDAAVGDVTISANTISANHLAGLLIDGSTLNPTGAISITGNTFQQNQTGIELAGPLTSLAIHNNFITANVADGILIDAAATSSIAIVQNYFANNGSAALRNNSPATIDATANYWGSENGPTSPLNNWAGIPKGQTIFGNHISLVPWYTDGTDTDPITPGFQPGALNTTSPTISNPDLAATSDTGYLNDDNITKIKTPTFTGLAEPGAIVAMFEDDNLLGSTFAGIDGTWTITAMPLADGPHNITARATNQAGNSTTSTALTIFIDTAAPLPNAGGTRTINENDPITLTGTFTDPAGFAPLFRSWHFVNSSNGQTIPDTTGDSISFQAIDNGVYTFQYEVTDAAGNTASDFATVFVSNVAPTAAVSIITTSIDENSAVNLTGTLADPGSLDAHTITIDWGDATPPTVLELATGATSIPSTPHTYLDNRPADAAYAISVTVADSDGGSVIASTSVVVKNVAPAVTLAGLPTSPLAVGTPIRLTATAADPGSLDTLTYIWLVTKTKNNITTTFATQTTGNTLSRNDSFDFTPDQGATYDISLTITDKDSLSATAAASITAADTQPTVSLTGTHSNPANSLANIAEGSPFTLTIGNVIDPAHPAGDATTQYFIHWGDTSPDTVLTEAQLNAASRQVTHVYTDGTAASDAAIATNQISVDLLTSSGTQYFTDAGTLGVVVFDLPPTANLGGSTTVNEGSAATILFFNQTDTSAQDASAGYTYSFDFNNDGIFEINNSPSSIATVPASFLADGPFDRIVAARIFDKDGFFTQYTRTIRVNNVAPTLNPGPNTSINQGDLFTRTAFFADPGAETWTATVDYGDGAGPQPLSINPNKTLNLTHSYTSPGQFTITLQITDKHLASATASFDINVIATPLKVINLTPTASGADIRFNRAIVPSVLNLYDATRTHAPDLTLTGALTGPVRGSAIWETATNTLHFIKTGAPLAADLYTLTLASRADGLVDLAGHLLDGDADNIEGGDYVSTFTITQPAVIISLPDFARGPGQPVNVAANGTATATDLPITISNGQNVQSVDFDLAYDPALLQITAVTLSPDLPAGSWNLTYNTTTPGALHVTLSGIAALSAGPRELVRIAANVPATAPYKASEAISFTNLRVNEGAIPAIGDAAVHKAVYFGDASGDGTVGSFDANRIGRLVVALDGTLAGPTLADTPYPLTDPLIIADVTGDGTLSGLDAAYVARKFVNPASVPQIPDIPPGPAPAPALIDPTLTLPTLTAQPGATLHVPLAISNANGFFAADLTLTYSNSILNLTDTSIALSNYLASKGWAIASHVTTATGQLRIAIYSTSDALPAGAPELLDLSIQTNPNATNNQSAPLHISLAPNSKLNEGQLALSAIDGNITIDTIRPTVAASQFIYDEGPQNVTIDFSEPVTGTLSANDTTLLNLTTNQPIAAANYSIEFSGHLATIIFQNLPENRLPDGHYRLTLNSSAITDLANNPLDIDNYSFTFFTQAGDANHDTAVNFADLVALAQHYGQAGETIHWSTGDFNNDAKVDFADLVTLAQNYNTTLEPPAAPSLSTAAAPIPPVTTTTAPQLTKTNSIVITPTGVAQPIQSPQSHPTTHPSQIPVKPKSPARSLPFATTPTLRAVNRPQFIGEIIQSRKKRAPDLFA